MSGVWLTGRVECHQHNTGTNIEVVEDVSTREEVGDKKKGPKDGTLGHTRSDEGGLKPEVMELFCVEGRFEPDLL